jgi:hypothetical protein
MWRKGRERKRKARGPSSGWRIESPALRKQETKIGVLVNKN